LFSFLFLLGRGSVRFKKTKFTCSLIYEKKSDINTTNIMYVHVNI
jgi:hypothetical protein